ncbi:hypothetical protein SO802_015071 [Lithocarpus litseifolius]|uniref:CCHC-type domain-containing protein n=1 Tax=Lithocarpus litseifolius TaxID=425828 RepID=A0AAW2CSP5_9ROSI
MPTHSQVSYKDSLVGDIPSAYAQAFQFDKGEEDEIRFPELPIEFYDPSVLREIGSAIGPVLRIDSYTALGSRASYTRLCVQIDLSKPVINFVRVGCIKQKVMYKGISSLCFCCGRLGHEQESCGFRMRPMEKTMEDESSERQKVQ